MDIRSQVEREITRLNKILALLDEGEDVPTKRRGRGVMSAAARKKICEAQRARWAKKSGAQPAKPKRTISAASRRKMAQAQRARWAKVKAQQKKAA